MAKMVGGDLLALGLEAYLNRLEAPISVIELIENLRLRDWRIEYNEAVRIPIFGPHGFTIVAKDFELLGMEGIYTSGSFRFDENCLRHQTRELSHEVLPIIKKLMDEGRIAKDVVFNKQLISKVQGAVVTTTETSMHFHGWQLPQEGDDCLWRLTAWWHCYGDLPWYTSKENCPCSTCQSGRVEIEKNEEDRLRYNRYRRLVKSFKQPVKEHSNNQCEICSTEFDDSHHNKRHAYRCVPKFGWKDELDDMGIDHFHAVCLYCYRTEFE